MLGDLGAYAGFSGWLFGNRSDTMRRVQQGVIHPGFSGWLFGNRSDTRRCGRPAAAARVSVDGSLATEVILHRRSGGVHPEKFQWMALWQQK